MHQMELNQSMTSSSSSSSSFVDLVNPDPADDDVTFRFNHLQIHNTHSHPPAADADDDDVTFQIHDSHDSNQQEEDAAADDDDDVSFGVNKIDDTEQEDEDDDDGDFTFMCVGDNDNETGSADVTGDGQIRTVFPLFDQSLLLSGDSDDGKRRLPIDVPVDNVFIESPRPRQSPSDNVKSNSTGTVTALPKDSGTPEINIKSNSTGFSKLWRFRNEMNRSNSDGRDAFVFLEASSSDGKGNGDVKVVTKEKKSKEKKSKKSTASAHEVYLKQKGGQTEEERKRSYLPYRPGLMGFFTNVNGGLSKNVHPF